MFCNVLETRRPSHPEVDAYIISWAMRGDLGRLRFRWLDFAPFNPTVNSEQLEYYNTSEELAIRDINRGGARSVSIAPDVALRQKWRRLKLASRRRPRPAIYAERCVNQGRNGSLFLPRG